MAQKLYLLKKSELPGDIEIHEDLLSVGPSALSRRRAKKIGRRPQEEMNDPLGAGECRICDDHKKERGLSSSEVIIEDRVAAFVNDFPYLSHDQRVVFLWTGDLETRKRVLHKYRLRDLHAHDLYWLLKGCQFIGHACRQPTSSLDVMRMVVGWNFGTLAGQSLPHFHAQCGWEAVLDSRVITKCQLALYFEELALCDLIIHTSETARVVAPWTPKGPFAIDLYFWGKHEVTELDDDDLRIFAVVGERLVNKYLSLGIQNLNIVFTNSAYQRQSAPLVAHFVPRVNTAALYEISGVTVVDTPPQKIAEEFRGLSSGNADAIDWQTLFGKVTRFDPDRPAEPPQGLVPSA